jgi:predicted amidophosphoribosyltransferase
VSLKVTTFSKVKTLRDYTRPLSAYIVQYLFTFKNPLYIALASNYKTRSTRMVMVMVIVIVLAVTSRRRRRQQRRIIAAVLLAVITRMIIITVTMIKLVIIIKVYNLLNNISFLLFIIVPF